MNLFIYLFNRESLYPRIFLSKAIAKVFEATRHPRNFVSGALSTGPTNYRKTPQDTARHRKTPQDTARHPQDTARHCKTPTRHCKGPQERRMQGYYRYSGVWWCCCPYIKIRLMSHILEDRLTETKKIIDL